MAWTQVGEELYGTVELDGETRRCRVVERDDEAGLVKVSIIEPGSPAEAASGDGEEARPPFVLAVLAERFTPDR